MFKRIKKQNGEGFSKALRGYHNGIFEIPELLAIVKHAGKGREDAESIIPYLMTLLQADNEGRGEIGDPFELLNEAGYEAYHADTLEKQNAIRKYFAPGEELCTFNDSGRYKHYYIINCVHKDAASLNRGDFRGKEKRQDAYGVSVLSIQVAKKGGFISIKNRYNHVVPNCDNTFGSNPDKIIEGLSQAIQEHFSVRFKTTASLPDNYVLAGNRLVKVVQEVGGVSLGNHCYVANGELHEMGEHEYLFDYFVFDARTKTFEIIRETNVADSFPQAFNDAYGGSPTVYVKKHCIYDGDTMLVGV